MSTSVASLSLKPLWTKNNIFYGVLTFSWVVCLWELYLEYRQFNVYRYTKKVPEELEDVLDQETFLKAKSYGIDKARYSLLTGFWGQIQTTITLYFYLMPFFWDLSERIMISYLCLQLQSNEIYQSLIFIFITSAVSTFVDLPLSLYYTFVIEQRHGFNNQTIGFYAWDKFKKFGVNYIIMAPVTATVIYIVRNSGPYFFLYLWIFAFVVMLVLVFFQSEIASLFDKFTPLKDGELRDKIEILAKSIHFPLTNIKVVEGSKRSSHSNAYFTGIFNRKQIVLYDTLIEDYYEEKDNTDESDTSTPSPKSEDKSSSTKKKGCTTGEIIAVLAHELGHWSHNHLVKNLTLAEINLFFMFVLFSQLYVNDTLYAAFGFTKDKPVIIGLTLMMMILAPYNELQGFLTIRLTRYFEYQADGYAKQKGYAEDLKKALVKLSKDNLGFPSYDELYSEFNHSHPTLIQRLKALGKVE